MTTDRWLAVVGIIIGLPGFIIIVVSAESAPAVSAVVFGLGLGGAAWWVRRSTNAALFTIVKTEIDCEIHDAEGKLATIRKTIKAYPNYGHTTEMPHKDIAADGKVTNIRWNGKPIPPDMTTAVLGEFVVRTPLQPPPGRGDRFEGTLSYDAVDSFLKDSEGFEYHVNYPTKKATLLRIHLPVGRPCRSATAYRMEGLVQRPAPKPKVWADRQHIELVIKRPRLGDKYALYWTW